MKKVLILSVFSLVFAICFVSSASAQSITNGCAPPSKCLDFKPDPPTSACDLSVTITDGAAKVMAETGITRSGTKLRFARQRDKNGVIVILMQGSPDNPNRSFSIRALGRNKLGIKIVECDGDEQNYVVTDGILDFTEQ